MVDTMRRWEMDAIGRDRLALRNVPIPVPGRHEVLVKVAAVSLNHRDKMVIEMGRGLTLGFPFTPGSDLAGAVEALGEDAARFAVGDRVISAFTPDWIDGLRPGDPRTPSYWTLGGHYPGVLAEYVAFPQDWFVRAPATLDSVHASTLSDWVDAVRDATGGRGVDHVLEIVGGPHLGQAAQVVAVGGRISLIGALDGFEVSAPVAPLLFKDVVVQGIGTGHRRALEDLVRAVDRTGLEPVVDALYPMAELPAALDHLDRGPFGKVVIGMA